MNNEQPSVMIYVAMILFFCLGWSGLYFEAIGFSFPQGIDFKGIGLVGFPAGFTAICLVINTENAIKYGEKYPLLWVLTVLVFFALIYFLYYFYNFYIELKEFQITGIVSEDYLFKLRSKNYFNFLFSLLVFVLVGYVHKFLNDRMG